MGTMHRELIQRKKATTIISLIVILCLMLFLSKALCSIKINRYKIEQICDPILFIFTMLFFTFQIFKCKVKYKYSIIVDKFIIHKISSNNEKVLEKIKLSDIVYVGENTSRHKKFNVLSSKKYICNLITNKTYCCIYKLEKGYKKIYFQPSIQLINKLSKFSNEYNEVV